MQNARRKFRMNATCCAPCADTGSVCTGSFAAAAAGTTFEEGSAERSTELSFLL
jgi:hypothetical protein